MFVSLTLNPKFLPARAVKFINSMSTVHLRNPLKILIPKKNRTKYQKTNHSYNFLRIFHHLKIISYYRITCKYPRYKNPYSLHLYLAPWWYELYIIGQKKPILLSIVTGEGIAWEGCHNSGRLSPGEGNRWIEKYSTHRRRREKLLPKPWDSFDRSGRFLRWEGDFVLRSIGLFRAG